MGWPSGTKDNETEVPAEWENKINMAKNYAASLSWIRGNNQGSTVFPPNKVYTTFWFEMFDEPWELGEPRGIGLCWGIYFNNNNPVRKFDPSN